MQVQMIPVMSDRDGGLHCGKVSFSGYVPEIAGQTQDYRSLTASMQSAANDKQPVVVMDVKGLRRGNMDEVLLKNLRIRGSKVWFMTQIETADDVLDAFNTDADSVLMPLHTVRDAYELESILEMSDSAVPVIFSVNRRTDSFLGRTDIPRAVKEMEREGFGRAIVIDTDGRLDLRDWKEMSGYGVIPYSEKLTDEEFDSIGMENVLRCLP